MALSNIAMPAQKRSVTRRDLVVKGGVVLGLTAAAGSALASTALADEAADAAADAPSFLVEPELGEITETVDADVCVVGLGIAGVAATRTLAEAGVKVVAIEKCEAPQGRSGDFGAINASCTERYEMTGLDVNEIVAELMKESGYKADARVLKAWAANSGADLDWYFGALPDLPYLDSITSPQPADAEYWVQPERYPLPSCGRATRASTTRATRPRCACTRAMSRPSTPTSRSPRTPAT